jgi:hypothetical protein
LDFIISVKSIFISDNLKDRNQSFLLEDESMSYFQAAVSYIPHFMKRAKGGEDAHFKSDK